MAIHAAILLPRYIDLILAGTKTLESRLTITRRTPYRRIQPGERIYFKASSGPYRATAVAGAVEFHDNLTPTKVAALRKRLNAKIGGDDAYWTWKRGSKYATFVELREVTACDDGPRMPPSQGIAWFTLDNEMSPPSKRNPVESFEVALSAGAVKNGYVPAPRGIVTGAGAALGLILPDGREVQTDLYRGQRVRWRGWREYFSRHGVRAGDAVRFEKRGVGCYAVSFVKRNAGEQKDASKKEAGKGDGSLFSCPRLSDFISRDEVNDLIARAKAEDLGPRGIDVTSELLVPAARQGRAVFRARQAGRLAGAAILPLVARAYDPALRVTPRLDDGAVLAPGAVVAEIAGPLRAILAAERVALNLLTHLSGIATLTSRYVEGVEGTRAGIYDTRKTHAGLRKLEKYAVVCGGGRSHRMGLYDAVLIKDNHIAHLSLDELPRFLESVIAAAARRKPRPKFVMVEVDTLAQLDRVLSVGPDIVLLDNMSTDQLRDAVALRDRLAPKVELEASGGVNLGTVRAIAQAGVDRISVGAITHSAPVLDLGLDIE